MFLIVGYIYDEQRNFGLAAVGSDGPASSYAPE